MFCHFSTELEESKPHVLADDMYFLCVQLVEERELLKQELQRERERRAREDADSSTAQVKMYACMYVCVYTYI